MHNSIIRDEASFLYHATYLCRELKSGSDGSWQVAPFQCSIPYSNIALEKIEILKARIQSRFPELFEYGMNRAQRAYSSSKDSITKPSYNTRISNFCGSGLNQLDSIVQIGSHEKCSGGLVFSVFSPNDLLERRRPGYVPCLISGSFLEHEGELQLNAFFRSQSVVEFGIFDLEFLRKIQIELTSRLNSSRKNKYPIVVGSLNLHFSRILIQRRLLRNRQGFIKREEVLNDWLGIVEETMLDS